jgi:hypothetical protein
MIGMNVYRQFKELEEVCDDLGFEISSDRPSYDTHNLIALKPAGERLSAYSRDAVIFRGDLDQCLTFLHGWRQSRYYLEIIGVLKNDIVEKAERKHLDMLESQRTMYALQKGRDPGDLRKKANKVKLEEDDIIA